MRIGGDGVYRFGEAVIERRGERLILRDPYTSREIIVDKAVEINISPVKPIHVPKNLTNHLLIRLKTPIYTAEPMMRWIKAPYELDIKLDGFSTAYLSPSRVKYYLFGDPVEGVLCRYHETDVYSEIGEAGGEAYIRLLITKVSKPLEYLYIPLENIEVWEEDEEIYYNPILVEGNGEEIVIKVVDRDPHKITLYEVPVLGEEYEEKWRYRI